MCARARPAAKFEVGRDGSDDAKMVVVNVRSSNVHVFKCAVCVHLIQFEKRTHKQTHIHTHEGIQCMRVCLCVYTRCVFLCAATLPLKAHTYSHTSGISISRSMFGPDKYARAFNPTARARSVPNGFSICDECNGQWHAIQ